MKHRFPTASEMALMCAESQKRDNDAYAEHVEWLQRNQPGAREEYDLDLEANKTALCTANKPT